MRRFKPTRTSYTNGLARLIGFNDGSEIFWLARPSENNVSYMVFYGKAQKPKDHYIIRRPTFEKVLEALSDVVSRVSNGIDRNIARKAESKRSRKDATGAKRLEVGSILCGSWGYEQTNVEFFEVIALSASGKTCTIQEIKHDEKQTGWASGQCLPLPGEYVGQPLKNRLIVNDSVRCEFCSLRIWDGREQYASHYA
jgi:hypothetical protein